MATWLTDGDATDLAHGVHCQKIDAVHAALIARKVWTVLKILRFGIPL